ncbi:hypothetical protein ACFZBP_39485 [Streptomyces sp. NPDC008086]|uniref:hypothetical protein n=1 Tax=Streptomyces sp. NPDC008086 TaxID=3364807 RepID=UPI0036F09054
MEAQFSSQAADEVDSDFVHIFNGFSQFWFTSLQFTDLCLNARSQQAFWSAVLFCPSTKRQSMARTSASAGSLFRHAVQQNRPYLEVCRHTLTNGLAAHHDILALASDEQRPCLDRYMRAFIHRHFHSSRYGWQNIYPGLAPVDF